MRSIADIIRTDGRHEGREQGKMTERQFIARRLLLEGSDANFVARVTGLTLERVNELKELCPSKR